MSDRFELKETLFPSSQISGLHFPKPSLSYHSEKPKLQLQAHGCTIVRGAVDLVFLNEVYGATAEVGKLLVHMSGGILEFVHPYQGMNGIVVIAKKGTCKFGKIDSSYRGIAVAAINNSPMFCFGCHAKSGGGHETQENINELLADMTGFIERNWRPAIGVAIGDFNTVLPDPRIAYRQQYMPIDGKSSREWRASPAGFRTHGDRALDFAWFSWGPETQSFKWETAHPMDLLPHYSTFSSNLSDHYPIAYDVTL